MGSSEHHASIADEDDSDAVRDDEETLADEDWAVPEQYRVEADSGPADEWPGGPAGAERPRRFPPDIGPGLLLVLLAALLLIPAGYLASTWLQDDEEAGGRTTETGSPTRTTTRSGPRATTPTPPAQVAVPDVVGEAVGDARVRLEDAGFIVRTEVEPSDRPTGEVLQQSPSADTRADRRSVVLLTLSGGVERITVPRVVGLSQEEADRTLREVGLRPETKLVPSDKPPGTVLRQRPGPNTRVDPDTVVRLDIAEERPVKIAVPRVVGLDVADARTRLRDAGLRSSVTRVESTKPVGTVVAQSPSPGAKVDEGASVALEVSSGPAQVTVEDVVGLDEVSARQALESAGFEVQVVDQPTSDVTEDGLVVAQDPAGGTQADEGSTVTLTVARLA